MSDWFVGADEFSPTKCARGILEAMRPGSDPNERATVVEGRKIHAESLRRESPAPSWQELTMATFFLEAFIMAIQYHDEDETEREMGVRQWKEMDWDKMWDRIKSEMKASVYAR